MTAATVAHTPGPWEWTGEGGTEIVTRAQVDLKGQPIVVAQAIAHMVAGHSSLEEDEIEANARLIAAAPNGYAAAVLWREYWLHDRECAECHRARRLGQACLEQVERFDRAWIANKVALAKVEGRSEP